MQARMKSPAIVIPEAVQALLAALILSIATTNVFDRLNVSTRQPASAWG